MCFCRTPLFVQLWFCYFPESEDAPGRRLAALPRRLFPCNDFHGSCSPDQSRSKRVCDAAYLGIKPNNVLESRHTSSQYGGGVSTAKPPT